MVVLNMKSVNNVSQLDVVISIFIGILLGVIIFAILSVFFQITKKYGNVTQSDMDMNTALVTDIKNLYHMKVFLGKTEVFMQVSTSSDPVNMCISCKKHIPLALTSCITVTPYGVVTTFIDNDSQTAQKASDHNVIRFIRFFDQNCTQETAMQKISSLLDEKSCTTFLQNGHINLSLSVFDGTTKTAKLLQYYSFIQSFITNYPTNVVLKLGNTVIVTMHHSANHDDDEYTKPSKNVVKLSYLLLPDATQQDHLHKTKDKIALFEISLGEQQSITIQTNPLEKFHELHLLTNTKTVPCTEQMSHKTFSQKISKSSDRSISDASSM